MSDETKTPPDGAGSGQGDGKNPPAPGAQTPPASGGKKDPQAYFYSVRGVYASSKEEHKAPGPGLKFGDSVKYTDAEFKALPKGLQSRLIPAKDWPEHVAALKRDGQLRANAIVPGVDK